MTADVIASIGREPRVAVVTGAATGIGAGIARALAADGVDLLLHYRGHADLANEVAQQCRHFSRRVEVAQADFADSPALASAVVETAVERLGRIDILVNNAAIVGRSEPFETFSQGLFDETIAVNLVAPFLATQAAAHYMISAGRGGRVINIGSVHARMAFPGYVAYEASKAAMVALTFSSAAALGRYGITVNCVAPGLIVHERNVPLDEEWWTSHTPIGRNGRPADIASLVVYLASTDAGFLTGETIYVDGGMTRRMSTAR